MPVWRDPLDELIAALERVTPVRTEQVFEEMPPMEDFCVLGQAILSRDPAERARLAVDPAVKRVEEYLHRMAHVAVVRRRRAGGLAAGVSADVASDPAGPFARETYSGRQRQLSRAAFT
jgi:hypothetical protein